MHNALSAQLTFFLYFIDKIDKMSLTAEESLQICTKKLNAANIAFDQWVSQNPTRLNSTDPEFRNLKQNVKLLKLERNEIIELKEAFQNTLFSVPNPVHDETLESYGYTKSRNSNTTILTKPINKLGSRQNNKISRG